MDEIDLRLIAALRRDGRASVSELAAVLGVTRNTVSARMHKLARDGEILGYSVVLRADTHQMPVRGIMLIEVLGQGTERVIGRLDALPEVLSIHTTNGKWDLIIELGTDTLESLDAVLKRIRLIEGIAASETNLYLSTRRNHRMRPG